MRAKKNRTIEYLDELDSENREKLMKWVKTYARKRRDFTRIQDAQIRKEISHRETNKRQKKRCERKKSH